MSRVLAGSLLVASLLLASPARSQDAPLTPGALRTALAANPQGAEAERLAEQLRRTFGRMNLSKGPNPKIDELTVAWALEAPGAAAPPAVVSADGKYRLPLQRVGSTDLYAASDTLPDGAALLWHYQVGETKLGGGQLEVYRTPEEGKPQPGVPQGKLTEMPVWESKVFPGTTRKGWVYVPAQYTPEKPACVMVWQDGAGVKDYVSTVFDNLIHKGEMPVTVGVFIDPGVLAGGRRNRSFEYDTLSPQYSRFLLEEILPEVEKTVKLRRDAASRAIGGSSSGGICAFTVAWERPDAFSKVVSWVGSFVNLAGGATGREGGHNYPAIIRREPKKPIRVFLQDGANDLDNRFGNWPLANLGMQKSLQFAGYDHKLVYGSGFHSGKHGRAILPDTLRWLWRDVR